MQSEEQFECHHLRLSLNGKELPSISKPSVALRIKSLKNRKVQQSFCCCTSPPSEQCQHTKSFLCLPQHIRQRIYELAFEYQPNQPEPRQSAVRIHQNPRLCSWDDHWIPRAMTFLLVCQSTFTEVHSFIYSKPTFDLVILESDNELLYSVQRWASNLPYIRQLRIFFDLAFACPRSNHKTTCPAEWKYLPSFKNPLWVRLIPKWKSVAELLHHHLTPNVVDLTFVSHVPTGNTVISSELLQPLLCFPKLLHCRIHLLPWRFPALLNQARETVIALTHRIPPEYSEPFRYLDLPQEIRLQILQYTDLVTPHAEVEWATTRKYQIRLAGDDKLVHSPVCHNPTSDCWRCLCNNDLKIGYVCFCPHVHSAFSSSQFDNPCSCWSPPTALFLVNHAMRQDAMRIFFRHNKFVLFHDGKRCADGQCNLICPLAQFLDEIVPREGQRYLRNIELLHDIYDFAPRFYDTEWNKPAYLRRSLLKAKDYMNVENLTIMLSIFEAERFRPSVGSIDEGFADEDDEYFEIHREQVFRFLDCMEVFSRSKRFFVQFAWRGQMRPSLPEEFQEWEQSIGPGVASLELQAEKHIKGEEYHYDPEEKQRHQRGSFISWIRWGESLRGESVPYKANYARLRGLIKMGKLLDS
jgi:hypothetical protein